MMEKNDDIMDISNVLKKAIKLSAPNFAGPQMSPGPGDFASSVPLLPELPLG